MLEEAHREEPQLVRGSHREIENRLYCKHVRPVSLVLLCTMTEQVKS